MKKWLWIIAGAGLALRLIHFNGALWYDEAFSAWLAGLPADRLIEATLGDVHPPGYYFLLGLVGRVAGYGEIAMRLPSLAAGVALIFVAYRLALALQFSPKTALLAAAMVSFSPFQIYYSQEARAYALLSLLVATAALLLVKKQLYRAALLGAAAFYLHNMAGFFIAALWLGGLVLGIEFKRLVKPGMLLTALSLPALYFTLHQAGEVGGDYWVPPLTSPGRLLATMDDLLWFAPNSPFVFATGLLTAAAVALLLYDLRRAERPILFLAIPALLPLLAIALASVVWQPVLVSRVLAPSAPFFIIWLADSMLKYKIRRWGALLAGAPTAALIIAAMIAGPAGRAPVDRPLLNTLRQADAIYHANLGSYIVWHYYLPDVPQYVWPQNTTLGQALSRETRQAMGVAEADFEFVSCIPLANGGGRDNPRKNWWFIYFNNPVTFESEIDYVNHLLTDYPAMPYKLLRKDSTTEGWLVKIDLDCNNILAKGGPHERTQQP